MEDKIFSIKYFTSYLQKSGLSEREDGVFELVKVPNITIGHVLAALSLEKFTDFDILQWIHKKRKLYPNIQKQFDLYRKLANYLISYVMPEDVDPWKELLNDRKYIWPTEGIEGWASVFGEVPALCQNENLNAIAAYEESDLVRKVEDKIFSIKYFTSYLQKSCLSVKDDGSYELIKIPNITIGHVLAAHSLEIFSNHDILQWIHKNRKLYPRIEKQFDLYKKLAKYLISSVSPDDEDAWKGLLNDRKYLWPKEGIEGWASVFGETPALCLKINEDQTEESSMNEILNMTDSIADHILNDLMDEEYQDSNANKKENRYLCRPALPVRKNTITLTPLRNMVLKASKRSSTSNLGEPPAKKQCMGTTLYQHSQFQGTRIIYERKFLMQCQQSPLAKTSPDILPHIPGVTSKAVEDASARENGTNHEPEETVQQNMPTLTSEGTRIIYERKFLMQCQQSPLAKTSPDILPHISGVTAKAVENASARENGTNHEPEETGTRIVYKRKFLMQCRQSHLAKMSPDILPHISGVTAKDAEAAPTRENGTIPEKPEKTDLSSGSSIFFVLDTNVLLDHFQDQDLMFLETISKKDINGQKVQIIIPYTVIQELDGLKKNPKVSQKSQQAIKWCNKHFENEDSSIQGQSLGHHHETINKYNSTIYDDRIRDCCLFLKNVCGRPHVCLVTNDVNLRNKALLAGLKCFSLQTLRVQVSTVATSGRTKAKRRSRCCTSVLHQVEQPCWKR